MQALDELYQSVVERKENPKPGSYTDYLFTKGLDKILKKVGEESTEVIVAAKNPDKSELRYETADLLYHLMVLLVEQGVSFDEIKEPLEHHKNPDEHAAVPDDSFYKPGEHKSDEPEDDSESFLQKIRSLVPEDEAAKNE